jgi:predicted kinase
MLVGIGGLPGTGKTTLLNILKNKGFVVFQRDEILASMFNPPDHNSREQKDAAYKKMLGQAINFLGQNKNVAIELSYSQKQQIMDSEKAAHQCNTGFKLIICRCSENVALKRIKEQKGHIATDRSESLYFAVKSRFEEIEIPHITINTEGPTKEIAEEISRKLSLH